MKRKKLKKLTEKQEAAQQRRVAKKVALLQERQYGQRMREMAHAVGMEAIQEGLKWHFYGWRTRQLVCIADHRHLALDREDFEAFLRGHLFHFFMP